MRVRHFICTLTIAALCLGQSTAKSESYTERARRTGKVEEITLRGTIEQALRNNLGIVIEDYETDLNRVRTVGAKGFYDPVLTFQSGVNSVTSIASTVLQGNGAVSNITGIPTETDSTSTFVPGLTQNIPGGGAFSFAFTNSRVNTDSVFAIANPSYGSNIDMLFVQPLWRGFLNTPVRHQLRILKLGQAINESHFRQTVSEIVLQVHTAYWNLVFALESYEVRRQSRDLALLQQDDTSQRVQSGLLTPVALTSARAEVAIREQDMIQAEVQILTGENALRRLISPAPTSPVWTLTLIPVDRPKLEELDLQLDEAVQIALKKRPELEQAALALKQNAEDRSYLKNQAKPQVNLSLGAGSVGRSGTIFEPIYGSDGVTPIGKIELPQAPGFGAYPTSFHQAFGFDFPNWSVAVNVQIPLRNRSLQAQVAEADVTRSRLQQQMKDTQQGVIVDVRNSYETLQMQRKVLETARIGRELSDEQLKGETARFNAGFTTIFEVLRYQRDFDDARVRELRSLIDFQLALSSLQKALDRIVDVNDIVIAHHR